MTNTAARGSCDAVGCAAPATSLYLHAHGTRLLEFRVCADHHARLRTGDHPVAVTGPRDGAPHHGRPGLVVGP